MSNAKVERIAVVGSGIGGLAFAACMKSLDTGAKEVVVYDSHDETLTENAGGALGLSGGAAILERLGCLRELQQVGRPVDKINFTYHNRSVLEFDFKRHTPNMVSSLISSQEGKPMIYTTRWSALRKVLHSHAFDRERPGTNGHQQGRKASDMDEKNEHMSRKAKKRLRKKRKLQHQEEPGNRTQSHTSLDNMQTRSEDEDSQGSNEPPTRVVFKTGRNFHCLEENKATGKIKLIFDDHSEEDNFDLVIGADGIRSTVRQHTAYPNKTLLSMIPIVGNFLPGSTEHSYTGVRVIQCLTPPITTDARGPLQEAARQVSREEVKDPDQHEQSVYQSTQDIMHSLLHKLRGEVRQWCGNGCNFLTMVIGDEGCERFVLATIYPESKDIRGNHGDNLDWNHEEFYRDKVKTLLFQSGFNEYHELHTLLEASSKVGGVVFDVGVHDNILPLRSWTSPSGRVILLGDSAHAM
jgi:2-polyprenyl-6-methoxyphenol hydroxylase-like FAD-dependent oxidoreductase